MHRLLTASCIALPLLASASWQDADALESIPVVRLERLPPIDLCAQDPEPGAVREAYRFTLVGEDRIAFVRGDDLVLISTEGALLQEIPLPDLEQRSGTDRPARAWWQSVTWLGADRVLLVAAGYDGSRRDGTWLPVRSMWAVDLGRGETELLGDAPDDLVRHVVATLDGAFVLGTTNERELQLHAYDRSGRPKWSLGAVRRLGNIGDVCATSDGRIALLDSDGSHGVQFVHADGRIGPFAKLERGSETVGRLQWILPALDGGLYVGVYDRALTIVRTDGFGRPVARIVPRFDDGQPIDAIWHASEKGRLWFQDGYSFGLLAADGRVERVIGEQREARFLRSAAWVGIGSDDRIFAVARRDGSTHVFDASGRHVDTIAHVDPPPPDVPRFVQGVTASFDEVSWPQAAIGGSWTGSFGSVCLTDRSGRVVREITPEAVGAWQFLDLSTAADGSACVRAASPLGRSLVILAPDGHVERTWFATQSFWPSGASHDGTSIAVALFEYVVIFDESFAPRFRVPIGKAHVPFCSEGEPDVTWRVHLARGGSELWVRRGPGATLIERYRMP